MVLVPTGAAANVRNLSPWYLLVLMVFSATGRIMGSTILYWLAGKLETALLAKRKRRFFRVTHKQIQQVGKRLGKGGWHDWATLFILNAIPIFPTSGLSVICGFLRVDFKMFAFCSFFGTMINALIFMSVGYAGVRVAETIHNIQFAGRITSGIIILVVLGLIIRHMRQRSARQTVKTSKR
jgi:membrane protein DedA with SNARE-associated domain